MARNAGQCPLTRRDKIIISTNALMALWCALVLVALVVSVVMS